MMITPPTLIRVNAQADDSTLSYSDKSSEVIGSDNDKRVSKWLERNRVKSNAEKTHSLTVGSSSRVSNLVEPITVVIDNMQINQSPKR